MVDWDGLLGFAVVILLLLFVLLLVLRELVCWYFKINKRIQLLDSINAKLDAQNRRIHSGEREIKIESGV